MRITGLATGLDMDQLVTDSMKPYRIKIDKKGQEKEILEIKQKLYREIIKDSRELYNKYFDITKSDSLLLSKNWTTTKFISSNDNVVIATGGGDTKPDNYTISGNIAKSSKISIASSEILDNKITINGKDFTLSGSTQKEKATNLNNDLKKAGINVKVTYTDFAGDGGTNASGFILESTILGRDSIFTVGGTTSSISSTNEIAYVAPTAAEITGFELLDFKDGVININIAIDGEEPKVVSLNSNDFKDGEEINKDRFKEILNIKLKEHNLQVEIQENDSIIFKSTKLGEISEISLSLDSKTGTFVNGDKEIKAEKTFDLDSIGSGKITVNGVLIDLSLKDGDLSTTDDDMSTIDYLNKVLKAQNLNITVKETEPNKITFTSNNTGENAKIDISSVSLDLTKDKLSAGGQDAEIVFKNSKGGIYTHKGTTNNVVLDGVTFKFTGDIPENTKININGKIDATETKDKLIKFINDYNTLIEKLNKLTTEKRNRNFTPLTAEQKKQMSEDEIKLWNERVEKGQLSRDTDLSRISNSLKNSMRTFVDGTGLNLEKIGIKPVADYQGTKNGTFTIDENILTKALEENSEDVMNLFIKSKPTDENLSDSQKYSKTGLVQRIKDILYKETMTSNSNFLKKVGYEGTVTAYDNTLTKSIREYERKMADMETDFARREQALYSKYSILESTMNKYNSQQSYLMQQLGMS